MFNISRMLSIYFGENLFYAFFSRNPTVKALHLSPCSVGRRPVFIVCSCSSATAPTTVSKKLQIWDAAHCSSLLLSHPSLHHGVFEIMSVFNYQNQYKNSSMLLDAKSRFIMHYEFKCRFLPSSYTIKIFFKVNIKARGIRTDTA